MTHFTAVSASVVGGGDATHWSQTTVCGNLFIVAELVGENASQAGVHFLKQLQSQMRTASLTRLENVVHFLKALTSEHAFSYVAALVNGSILYVVVEKKGSIWIKRGNKKQVLITGSGTASGTLSSGDIFCLTSAGFNEAVETKDIQSALELLETTAIAEALTLSLHKKDSQAVGCALLLGIDQKPVPQLRSFTFATRIKLGLISLRSKLPSRVHLKPLVVVISVLVFLLALSIYLGLKTKRQHELTFQTQQVLSQVTHKYEEGIALVDLNPIRARELLAEAKGALAEIAKTKLDKTTQTAVIALENKINEGINFALRSFEITPSPYYQLELIKPDATGTSLALYQDVLVILDSKNKSLYRLLLATKASKIIAGGDVLSKIKAVAIHGEDIYILDDAIRKVTISGTLQTIIEPDAEWGNLVTLAAYAGNIYVLDSAKNQIWKYIKTDSGFSSRQDYLLFDTVTSLIDASQIMIDGAVWVIKKDEIMKFVQGKEVLWDIKGLDQPLGSQLGIYTDDTTKNIYVLDRNHNRVIATDKDGTYLAQYSWSDQLSVSSMVVSEVLKKILLLSRGTIYAIDLK